MRFEVSHRTTYRYRQPVVQSQNVLHLQPRITPRQTLLNHSLLINPAPVNQSQLVDSFGNPMLLLNIDEEHAELVVHARSTVDVSPAPETDLAASPAWEDVAMTGTGAERPNDLDVIQFTSRSRHTAPTREIARFARTFFTERKPLLAGAMNLTMHMFREFRFDATATDVSTPPTQVLETRRGVCQDFAHLAIAALRSLGLPVRYVSGYLLTRPPPGHAKLKGADASHAWISVWSPGTGWVDFDPTNGIIPSDEHITVAWGRDYEDVSPISGVLLGGGEQQMTVGVDVVPL